MLLFNFHVIFGKQTFILIEKNK